MHWLILSLPTLTLKNYVCSDVLVQYSVPGDGTNEGSIDGALEGNLYLSSLHSLNKLYSNGSQTLLAY